jgi:hypothetical protein
MDDGDDIKWLTYAELGQIRGISKASATRLAFRRKWRRQDGNAKTVRVAVPIDEARPQMDVARDNRGDVIGLVGTFDLAVATLREQLERERTRADQAEDRATGALARARETQAMADQARAEAQQGVQAADARTTTALALLRDAGETLKAEQAARMAMEIEAGQLRGDAQEATQAVEAEVAQLRQALGLARQEATEQPIGVERARAEALQVALDQVRAEAEALRQAEVARATEAAREPAERSAMVASRIDEVQFRRLQEREQTRKALGRLARLRAAWRGE